VREWDIGTEHLELYPSTCDAVILSWILAGYRPNLLALEISGTLGSDNIEALKGEIESTLRLCHGLEVLKIAAAAETWEVNPMVAALVVSPYLDHLFPQAG